MDLPSLKTLEKTLCLLLCLLINFSVNPIGIVDFMIIIKFGLISINFFTTDSTRDVSNLFFSSIKFVGNAIKAKSLFFCSAR